MKKHTILCVDDEKDNLDALERLFRKKYSVLRASSGVDAIKILNAHHDVSVIVTDQRMPSMSGIEFLEKIKDQFPQTTRVLLTGYTDLDSVISAVNKAQIFRYVSKPWDPNELLHTIDQAVHKYELSAELVTKNAELIAANKELKSLDVAKNNFMILINHELKTPLTAITSYADLLSESTLNNEQTLMLTRIKQGADKLRSLIEDVLLIVRSETNQLKLDFQKTPLSYFEEIQIDEYKKLLDSKNMTIKFKFDSHTCRCDQRLIKQVLSRLLHNALKFGSADSEIIIEGKQLTQANSSAIDDSSKSDLTEKLQISITNQGSPISQKIIDRVFNPFYIDENIMHHSTGMGLGLSVCQTILKHHNSRLKIQNLSGKVQVYFELTKI